MRLVSVAIAVVLSACSSTGTKVDPDVVASRFKSGVTTYAEVVAALGKPNSVTTDSDGKVLATYMYMHQDVNAASYIPVVGPVVGMFSGGASSEMTMATFTFDANRVLVRYTTTVSSQ